MPGLEELLATWEELRGPTEAASYFAFAHERRTVFEASAIDGWLGLILGHLHETPPQGEAWTGHSLRKGAASGAGAIDVALFRICFMGGWSVRGGAVHDYIDASWEDRVCGEGFLDHREPLGVCRVRLLQDLRERDL